MYVAHRIRSSGYALAHFHVGFVWSQIKCTSYVQRMCVRVWLQEHTACFLPQLQQQHGCRPHKHKLTTTYTNNNSVAIKIVREVIASRCGRKCLPPRTMTKKKSRTCCGQVAIKYEAVCGWWVRNHPSADLDSVQSFLRASQVCAFGDTI